MAEDIPPAGWVNWFWNLVGDWLTFLSTAPTVYDTLQDAYADTTAGDIVIVDEKDGSLGASPGESKASGLTAGIDVDALCCTGKSVIYASGANLVELARDDFATVIRTYAPTVVGNITHVTSDGSVLVLIAGFRYVECLRLSDGVSLWTYDATAAFAIGTACICRNRYVVAGSNGAGDDVACLNLATGALYWSFNHGATVYGIAAAGARVFLAGHASGFASGATLRCLRLDTGAAATNEGGAAVDATGTAWNQVQPDRQEHFNTLATDGRHLFCGMPLGAASQLEVRGCGDGEVLQSKVITNYDVQGIAVDQGFVFVVAATAGALGRTMAFDRTSFAMAWAWADPTYDHAFVAADGTGMFVGRAGLVAGQPALYRRHRGNRPTMFRRLDYTVDNDAPPCLQALSPAME